MVPSSGVRSRKAKSLLCISLDPTIVLLTHYLVFSSTGSAALRPTQIITSFLFQSSAGSTSSEDPLLLLTMTGPSTLSSIRAGAHAHCLPVSQQHQTATHPGLILSHTCSSSGERPTDNSTKPSEEYTAFMASQLSTS